jgi:lipoprotein-releasing system ATP-binding protein
MPEVLNLKGIYKSYRQASYSFEVLKNLDLSLNSGSTTAILGASGSGKSTLLHISGLLDSSDAGKVIIQGEDLSHASDKVKSSYRLENIGFVYQFHHLLPEFSAFENVVMPGLIARRNLKTAEDEAYELLSRLRMNLRMFNFPGELSGGEQQRVALARSLINKPSLLIADEPTGNLDKDNSEEVLELMKEQAREQNVAVLVATHNLELAREMDEIYNLNDGKLEYTSNS